MSTLPADRAVHRLAARWAGDERLVVVDSTCSAPQHWLALWQQWRDDAHRSPGLTFIATGGVGEWEPGRLAVAAPGLQTLAARLIDELPPRTTGIHRLAFEDGALQLLLWVEPPAAWPRQLVAKADALLLRVVDFDRCARGEWNRGRIKAFARLAAPGATLSIEAAGARSRQNGPPGALRAALAAEGFMACSAPPAAAIECDAAAARAPGASSVPWSAEFRPRGHAGSASIRPEAGALIRTPDRHAIVVGAGLAGCATAWALAQHGWQTTLVDRQPSPAAEASGNPGGIFHGVFHPGDALHAQLHRSAALEAQRAVATAIRDDSAAGAIDGLLRLQTASDDVDAMRERLRDSGLPASYVVALDRSAVAALSGIAIDRPAWFYPGGGWVDPAALARSYLRQAGHRSNFLGGVEVARLVNAASAGAAAPRWQAVDDAGRVLAEAPVIVLANAGSALRLSGWPWRGVDPDEPACHPVRGQLSSLNGSNPGVPVTRLPLSGAGYLLPPTKGRVVFGATAQRDDLDLRLRQADHADNLRQLARLTGTRVDVDAQACDGRAGLRWVTADRLPLIGAVPLPADPGAAVDDTGGLAAAQPAASRLDQPHRVPRVPGLYLYAALGSRGIGWSALGGQIIASWVSGAPAPVAAPLRDALDPARLVSRATRRRHRA